MIGGIGGFGYGWSPPVCVVGPCFSIGDHVDNGSNYCKLHYFTVVKKMDECPGCLMTGKMHSNGLPCQSGAKCPLCKGEGFLQP